MGYRQNHSSERRTHHGFCQGHSIFEICQGNHISLNILTYIYHLHNFPEVKLGCFIFWFSNIADRNIRVQFGAASVQFHIVSAMLVSGRFLVYLCSYCLWYVGKWERHMVWFVQVEGHVNRIDKKSHHLITSFSFFFLLFFMEWFKWVWGE